MGTFFFLVDPGDIAMDGWDLSGKGGRQQNIWL